MRQKLVIIESESLADYDIPKLHFDENVIIIVYDEFLHILFRYVHTPRIFLLPRYLYDQFAKSTYSITDHRIVMNNKIIDNTNATIDGVPFFPADLIQLDAQKEYLKKFREYIPERTVDPNLDDFAEAIEYLKSIKVPVENFSNLEMRIQRLSDFGDPELAEKLIDYYKMHEIDFLNAASLSIQFNDIDDVSFSPLQTGHPALYCKLNNSTGVYSWNGYSTFIDTLTRVMFYKKASDFVPVFMKYFEKHKPVMIVYGILNYHIAQNIHEITNKNVHFYNLLEKELK